MPYTLSHVSVPLLFKRHSNFDRLAAVLGSLVPDLGYLLGWSICFSDKIHGWTGALIFGLPITLLLYFGVLFFKGPLFILTGFSFSNHLTGLSPKKILAWTGSAILGLWSHVFLDGFTHLNGWAGMKSYHLLQYVLSLLGIFILGYFTYRKKTYRLIKSPMKVIFILACLTACLLSFAWGFSHNTEILVVQLTVNWMRWMTAFSLIYCTVLKIKQDRPR